MAADLSSLEPLLKCWEFGEYASAAIVIVGVAGEFVADFTNIWDVKVCPRRKDNLGKVSTLVLIVGLVLEVICLYRANALSGQIIARLQNDTAELQATTAPRDLTEDQRRQIIAACTSFAGQTVHVRSQVMDLEGWRLGQQIILTLRAARLNVEDDTLNMFPGFGAVIVGIRVSGPAAQEDLSSAIRSSLGNLTKPSRDFNRVPQDESFVTVFVGVKPLSGMEW